MADTAQNQSPTPSDIINAYRLALGRDPETQSVVEEKVKHAGQDWLSGFFTSPEFSKNIRDSVLRGMLPTGLGFAMPPQDALIEWAASKLPLCETVREQVRSATEWPDLFMAIFADETFSATVLKREAGSRDELFLSALEHLVAVSSIKGAIESVTSSEVRGWALDTRNPARRLAVELRFGGIFAGAAVPGLFRGDLQERFGGNGEYGFVLHFSAAAFRDCSIHGELRDAGSQAPLATVHLPPSPAASIELIVAVRQELDGLRSAIARIEARLPALNSAVSFSLDSYDEYFKTYYAPREAAVAIGTRNIDLTVLVTFNHGGIRLLDRTLLSLERQSARPSEIVVVYDKSDFRLEIDYLVASYRERLGESSTLHAVYLDDQWQGRIEEVLHSCASQRVLFVQEPLILAPEACAAFTSGFDGGAALLFADDDLLYPDRYTGTEQHIAPQLRGCWDGNHFYQVNYLGPLLGIRRDRIHSSAARTSEDGSSLDDLVFGIVEDGREADIVHLPQVLAHRLSDSEDVGSNEGRKASLERHLRRLGSEATVELHSDPLGAKLPGALRVCFPIASSTRATLIIPTRDRPDLLGPCLASLTGSKSGSSVEFDVIVVDNQSVIPPSGEFFAQFPGLLINLMNYDGAFNWALINNRAAQQTNADVLIFLNDDTVLLSQDSVDELCRQALRTEIGAVGARLLYEDGTLQHAGMVMDPWHSFATHEGVGATASDPGYLGRNSLVRQVSTVTGACLATRSSLFKESGGFDSVNFPVEGNDTDYCLRLRALGYQIIYDPYATFYHFESKTRGFNIDEVKRERASRATRVLRERWGKRFEKDPFYNSHFDRLSAPFSRLVPPQIDNRTT